MQPGFMSPASLAELKRSIDADRARKLRLLVVPSNLDIALGIAKVREIKAGDRVRIANNEGAVEFVLSGASEGKVVVKVDKGPFAGSAYVVDGEKCEVIST